MADFGLTEDMYGTNYYRRKKNEVKNEEKVPIRWMPPESIENNIYNERTDVVSSHAYTGIHIYSFIKQSLNISLL